MPILKTHTPPRYHIISPVRDEADYIKLTLESVINQTIKPVLWIIVNDGSTDATGPIIDNYAKAHPWIKAVHRSNRGARVAGGGVIEAFYDGYNAIKSEQYDFIIKLDADYFEKCFSLFADDGAPLPSYPSLFTCHGLQACFDFVPVFVYDRSQNLREVSMEWRYQGSN